MSYCEYKGKRFRVLLYDENGAWMICGDGKTRHRYVNKEVMKQTTSAGAPAAQVLTTISLKRHINNSI